MLLFLTATFIGDFLAVHLVNGYIRVTISLGADPIYVELTKGARLDDGEWHTVEMIRALKVSSVVCLFMVGAVVEWLSVRLVAHRSYMHEFEPRPDHCVECP